MKILTSLIAFLIMLKVGFAQQPNLAPLGGSAPQAFTLTPDRLGDVSSSVNLFTGDLTFPINLVSLPGRNGLDVSAAIAYSSNVDRQANTWNAEAPTGVVGLGWSFDYPKIIVDNKMTGTREDDTYYVVEGGSSNKLIYIGGTASSGKKYATKNYQFWTITFYPNDEKWEIVKEDGTRFIYGDKNSGRSTVQWIVTWNNWIGSSNVTNSSIQKQQGLVWNLSEIINLWGEKIRYSYLNINQKVGGTAGKEHTEASYLSTITDVFGRTVNFVYGNKSSQEYQEPHTENGTNQIDAYQERYETKFLDYINVNDSDGALLYKVDLDYSTMGTGDMTKRLLTSVTQYNAFNQALPGHTFQYNTAYSPTINFGALTSITTPTGGVLNYTYAQQTLTRAVREKKVTAVSGYQEPKVWIGSDYVIVTRRQLSTYNTHTSLARNVLLQVFTWDGEWLEWSLTENLPNISVSEKNSSGDWVTGDFNSINYKHQDFHVSLQRDFFAVLFKTFNQNNVYTLRIYRKDENQRGGWAKFENTNINLAQNILQEANLVSGENFVAVASKRTNIHVYKWNGTTWSASTISRNTGNSDHNPIVAGHNFIISHKRYYATGFPINLVPDDIKFYFFNEDGSVVTRTAPTFSDTYTDDKSYWYAAASFAVVMADDNPEYFYVWDENYNLQRKSLGYGLTDNSYVSITDNSMVTIVHWNVSENYAARYNGENFIISPNLDASLVSSIMPNPFTFGEDFVLRPKSGSNQQVGLTYFNPNNNTWNNINYNTVNKTSARAGYNFFVKAHATDNSKADIVYRRPNGSFSVDLTSPTIQNLHTNNARFPWQVGNNFIVKNRGVNDGQTFLGEIQSVFFQNGKIDPLKTNFTTDTGFNLSGENPAMHWVGNYDHTYNLVGGNVIVTFLNAFYQFDATEVKLFKLIDQAANGPLTDFAVQKVSVNDGENTTHSFIGYDLTRATYDASASVAQYHKVTVYPGVQSVDLSNGSTEYFFYNGIKSAESASPFPSATDDSYTKLLSGSMYRSNVLNNTGSLVAYSVSFTSVLSRQLMSGSTPVETAYYARPIKTWQSATGTFPSLLTETNFEYNSNGLLLRRTDKFFADGLRTIEEDYKYWYEEYDPTLTRNILTPIIQTKRTVQGGLVTDCSVVKYKSWGPNNVPAPYQMYSWKRTGLADFSAWALASNPSTDWRLVNTIDDMDTSKGLVKQTTAADGTVTKTIWDGAGKQVVATAIMPQNGHVIYNGFEECASNCSSEAKTGLKSSDGPTLIFPSLPSNTYKVTYWQKPSAQANWEYVETTFTGTSYSVPHTWIDELRIAPVSARIVSYAYDRYGNVISACDENNMITHKEYDEFNRPKLTRDQDGKIREFTVYNIRN